jgi:hypothetical protein
MCHLSAIKLACQLASNPFYFSLDDPVSPRQHIRWNGQADLLCRFKIYDELELRRLFHWKVSGLDSC